MLRPVSSACNSIFFRGQLNPIVSSKLVHGKLVGVEGKGREERIMVGQVEGREE